MLPGGNGSTWNNSPSEETLHVSFVSAALDQAGALFNQPVVAWGENKRLLELSVAEAGQSFVKAGLITAEELERTLAEIRRMARDENILAVMPRMSQVWARKPTRRTGELP